MNKENLYKSILNEALQNAYKIYKNYGFVYSKERILQDVEKEFFKQANLEKSIKKPLQRPYFQWKTGKNDSCERCKELNGRVFDYEPDRIKLAHFGCKCDIFEIDGVLAQELIAEHEVEIKKRDEVVKHITNNVKVEKDGKWYNPVTGLEERNGKYGDCARYVREAIEKNTDLKIGQHGSAYNYGKPLEGAGFMGVYEYKNKEKDIDMNRVHADMPKSYKPQKGDIAIFQATTHHQDGHMTMFDGTNWVSDFVQRDMWGGSIRKEAPSYVIYRNPKWSEWDDN